MKLQWCWDICRTLSPCEIEPRLPFLEGEYMFLTAPMMPSFCLPFSQSFYRSGALAITHQRKWSEEHKLALNPVSWSCSRNRSMKLLFTARYFFTARYYVKYSYSYTKIRESCLREREIKGLSGEVSNLYLLRLLGLSGVSKTWCEQFVNDAKFLGPTKHTSSCSIE